MNRTFSNKVEEFGYLGSFEFISENLYDDGDNWLYATMYNDIGSYNIYFWTPGMYGTQPRVYMYNYPSNNWYFINYYQFITSFPYKSRKNPKLIFELLNTDKSIQYYFTYEVDLHPIARPKFLPKSVIDKKINDDRLKYGTYRKTPINKNKRAYDGPDQIGVYSKTSNRNFTIGVDEFPGTDAQWEYALGRNGNSNYLSKINYSKINKSDYKKLLEFLGLSSSDIKLLTSGNEFYGFSCSYPYEEGEILAHYLSGDYRGHGEPYNGPLKELNSEIKSNNLSKINHAIGYSGDIITSWFNSRNGLNTFVADLFISGRDAKLPHDGDENKAFVISNSPGEMYELYKLLEDIEAYNFSDHNLCELFNEYVY